MIGFDKIKVLICAVDEFRKIIEKTKESFIIELERKRTGEAIHRNIN